MRDSSIVPPTPPMILMLSNDPILDLHDAKCSNMPLEYEVQAYAPVTSAYGRSNEMKELQIMKVGIDHAPLAKAPLFEEQLRDS
jgi:hypothetical protein